MGGHINPARKRYNSHLCRSLQGALAQMIGEQFPRIGGSRMRELCADMVLEIIQHHLPIRDHMSHGQILWTAVSKDDPPTPRRPFTHATLVPVVLSVSTPEDIHLRIERVPGAQRLTARCVRMCREAYEQGGLLSNADISEILGIGDSRIANVLSSFEKESGTIVPRRATLHDQGSAITHKRIICLKRWREGKSSEQVARETFHTIEAVDRYLGMFERVRCCRINGMDVSQTAFALNCTQRLVHEYLQIDALLKGHKHSCKE